MALGWPISVEKSGAVDMVVVDGVVDGVRSVGGEFLRCTLYRLIFCGAEISNRYR